MARTVKDGMFGSVEIETKAKAKAKATDIDVDAIVRSQAAFILVNFRRALLERPLLPTSVSVAIEAKLWDAIPQDRLGPTVFSVDTTRTVMCSKAADLSVRLVTHRITMLTRRSIRRRPRGRGLYAWVERKPQPMEAYMPQPARTYKPGQVPGVAPMAPQAPRKPTPPPRDEMSLESALDREMPFGKFQGETFRDMVGNREGLSYIWWLANEADITSHKLAEAIAVVYENYEEECEDARQH